MSINGSGVVMGGGSQNGYLSVGSTVNFTTSAAYGYIYSGGAGTYPGGTQTMAVAIYTTTSGRIISGEIDAFSDVRLKNIMNEISYEDSRKLVLDIVPVNYTWKTGDDRGLKAGFIAQDVVRSGHSHLVGLVPNENMQEHIDMDGFLSPAGHQFVLAYEQIIPYHNKVLAQNITEIDMLKQEIEALKQKIEKLQQNN
jgi:hypothetical protein